MKKNILIPSLSLFVICLAAAVLLVFTNQATADKIEQMEVQQAKESQAKVMDLAAAFTEKTVEQDGKTFVYQIGTDETGEIVGYVFTTTANGYGGQVKIMTGVLPDGVIHKIEVLDVSNETPGLGLNAQNDAFRDQFTGKTFGLRVTKNEPSENQIKAMTGATITSNAVTSAVTQALELFQTVTGGSTAEEGAVS